MSYFLAGLPTSGAGGGQSNTGNLDFASAYGYDVFLLIGQSNMQGQTDQGTDPASNPTDPDIHQWGQFGNAKDLPILAIDPLQHPVGNCGASIGMAFARMYRGSLARGRKVLLVPCAWGGTGFLGDDETTVNGEPVTTNWMPGTPGNLLDLAIKRTNKAMAYEPFLNSLPAYVGDTPPTPSPFNVFKGILWHQGESNGGTPELEYKGYLYDMVQEIRTKVVAATDDTVFIVGLPTPWYVTNSQDNFINNPTGPMLCLPRVGDIAYFDLPNCAYASSMIPTRLEDTTNDGIHFSGRGLRDYGARYFEQYQRLTRSPVPSAEPFTHTTTSDSITLRWATMPSDGVYNVYAFTDVSVAYPPAGGTLVSFTATRTATATLGGLSPGTAYVVSVNPRRTDGTPGPETRVTITTGTGAGDLLTDLLAAPEEDGGITVSWVADPSTTSVRVSYARGSPPSGAFATLNASAAGPLTIPAGSVMPGTYTIRAVPYDGATAGSTVTTTVTVNAPVSVTPTLGRAYPPPETPTLDDWTYDPDTLTGTVDVTGASYGNGTYVVKTAFDSNSGEGLVYYPFATPRADSFGDFCMEGRGLPGVQTIDPLPGITFGVPSAFVPSSYSFTARMLWSGEEILQAPSSWTFQGSVDGETWTVLDTIEDAVPWPLTTAGQVAVYPVTGVTTAYSYFKWVFTKIDSTGYVAFHGVRVYD